MSKKYDEYLIEHRSNVKKGYEWLKENLPFIVSKKQSEIEELINNHDKSKDEKDEYEPYDKYFYGEKTKSVEDEFNKAWLFHIHRNPHHWQHWVLIKDDGKEPILIDIPYEYIVEMICDWWSFSWKTDNLYEIFKWYKDHKNIMLSNKTQKIVDKILDEIKNKLAELK